MAALKTPLSGSNLLPISLLTLSLFFLISAHLSDHSPATTAATFASRLLFTSNTHFTKPETDSDSDSDLIRNLSSCNIFDGKWVLDENSDPLHRQGSCPLIDGAFDCFKNGRPDSDYVRFQWKPNGCRIPRFDGRKMLEILRGKRMVFVGDSLNRNMWESLVCALRHSLNDSNTLFQVSRRRKFRTQGFHSFRFRVERKYQDCSHWCLPGVPDSWNQLLYTTLFMIMLGWSAFEVE